MMHLLARENGSVLAQLAWSNVLVTFDFDGTLAPIIANRHAARMRGPTSRLLAKVCQLYPCAVISGRSQRDVWARLGDASVKYVVGNHGLEPGATLDEFEEQVALARELLRHALAPLQGVDVEDKRYSLALHYRRSRSKRLARSSIHDAVAALPVRMRIIPGKQVVNVLPADAPNKGDALLELRKADRADTALYIGDDTTDEDVFKLDQPGRLVTVRVGESLASAATYYLRTQRDIDRLLAKLVSHRERGAIT
jgi:trehalose 6-phosphate phosphatase